MSNIAERATPEGTVRIGRPQVEDGGTGGGNSLTGAIDRARELIARGDLESRGRGLRLLIDLGNAGQHDRKALATVGSVLCEVKAFDIAYRFLKQCVILAEDDPHSWKLFATCLIGMKQYQAARIAADRAAALGPQDPVARLILGRVLFFLGENDGAIAAYDGAIEMSPTAATKVTALLEKGQHLQALGDLAGARAVFFNALELKPDCVNAYYALVAARTRFEDPDAVLANLQGALDDGLASEVREMALFSIGELLAGQERFDEAFPNFLEANRSRAERTPYRHASVVAMMDRLIRAFTPETFEAFAEFGDPTLRPVFIVGMPRSGTTLTEAVLSRHPRVKACGERQELPRIAEMLSTHNKWELSPEGELLPVTVPLAYPADLVRMDRAALAELRRQYLDNVLRDVPETAARFTDKMPFNFVHLGLIGVFFPNARIVHCTRDAMDTCLSCFTQNFADDLSFSHDLGTLGRYWREYRRLMSHWQRVLPNPMLELAYEDMVRDQEATSRRLVAHVGLDWDDACLDFHRSDFEAKTASSWQVRQKIYTTSLAGWRRYEKFLGPLQAALAGDG